MFRASLYISICSARNRLRTRLKRLREPRYFVGAAAGAAWLYFTVFARMRGADMAATSRRRRAPPAASAVMGALYASGAALTGLLLMVLMAAAWLVPFDSGLLDFTPAEVDLLFPA